jgi:hypothetical protein
MHGQEGKDISMGQGEKTDSGTDQEIEDTARGQQTHAKLPRTQSATQTLCQDVNNKQKRGGGVGYWQQHVEGGEGVSSKFS